MIWSEKFNIVNFKKLEDNEDNSIGENMLVRFSVENWMSFRDKMTLSMIADDSEEHRERIPMVSDMELGVLPVAAIFGGNAAGKTNLFRALRFAQELIVNGTKPSHRILVEPCKLSKKEKPSNFEFELLIGDVVYTYVFSIAKGSIVSEKLTIHTKKGVEDLFSRNGETRELGQSLKINQALQFAFSGTGDNQLFVTNTISQKIDDFRPIYEWFQKKLVMITPDAKFLYYDSFLDENDPLSSLISEFDTGIVRFGLNEVSFEMVPILKDDKDKIMEGLREGQTVRGIIADEFYILSRIEGEIVAKKLVTHHLNEDGEEVPFEFREESDGTRRLIDLLPAFVSLSKSNGSGLFVIDELDRSLHTLITKRLLETYLETCSPTSRAQLLFTTHDLNLMNKELLRVDEMWLLESKNGVSNLFSVAEFEEAQEDPNVLRSYLDGRMGGTSNITYSAKSFRKR